MLNKAILMGRLTADPELKQTPSGVYVTSFSIACDRNFQGKDGQRQVDFINIVAWRNTAEFICRYFSKGRMIALEGSIQTRNYEDKSGNKRTAFEILADQVYFADSAKQGAASEHPAANNNFPAPDSFNEPSKGSGFSVGDFEEVETDDSELPF